MEAKVFRKKCYTLLTILVITALSQTNAQSIRGRNYSDTDLIQQRRNAPTQYDNSRNFNRGYHQTARVNVNNRYRYGRRGYAHRPRFRNNYLLPIGTRVGFIPNNAIAFRTHQRDYFYARGNFYTPTYRGYRVVRIPVGARVTCLPRRAYKVFRNRNVYYQLDDLYLTAFVNRRGNVMYEIAGCV